jgi:hypothetical protein
VVSFCVIVVEVTICEIDIAKRDTTISIYIDRARSRKMARSEADFESDVGSGMFFFLRRTVMRGVKSHTPKVKIVLF